MIITRRKVMSESHQVASTSTCPLEKTKKCKDLPGICLLTGLYVLQGIPLGLAASIPYLLQSDAHTANYRYQAIFSWVFWPFSLKLAWAPIVDSLYVKRFGRRKTWLIPIQYAIGIDLFVLASRVDNWLGREEGHFWGPLGVSGDVQIWGLTCAFFGLTLLAATQDIIVDGWALTMLSKENVGWASTCNSVGQTLGYILGFIVFLALESPDVCNSYLRSTPVPGKGIVSFSGFLYFCGGVFLTATTLVAIFKSEAPMEPRDQERSHSTTPTSSLSLSTENRLVEIDSLDTSPIQANDELEIALNENRVSGSRQDSGGAERERVLSLWQAYRLMLRILRLRPVLRYIVFVFLIKFVFSASDSVFGLKVLEHGVTKERLALIGSAMLPLQALLPFLITHWSNGPRPLGAYLNAAIPRVVVATTSVVIVHYIDYFRTTVEPPPDSPPGTSPTYIFSASFYIVLIAHLAVYAFFSHTMFVCQMAYHAKVSDPSIGGTYMTLLNTAANLAASLPSTLMLFLVDPLTFRTCENPVEDKVISVVNHTAKVASTVQLQQLADHFIAHNATCKGLQGVEACRSVGGTCRTIVEGFYIEMGFCLVVGLVAYFTVLRRMAASLDTLPLSAYRHLGRKTSRSNCEPVNQ
uniref:Acetyl-coenzyme A transporter 1 n=1 Tax=Mesocestoides corti TaxID=53468 RepID=A0A5K3F3T6_MESCO